MKKILAVALALILCSAAVFAEEHPTCWITNYTYKYHPDPVKTGAFKHSEDLLICDCCGKSTHEYYDEPFYSAYDELRFCPACVKSGAACEKYDGSFQDIASLDSVSDDAKTAELLRRTPGYEAFQQEYWRAHCDDYCAYLGVVSYADLLDMGIVDEVMDDAIWEQHFSQYDPKEIILLLEKGSQTQGYLFQCLHCGKYLLWVDND